MQLGITIPLQKYLKRKAPSYGEPCDLFFCWELHVILLQGKSTLVAVNANNRYAIILSGMKACDWKLMTDCFVEGLTKSLIAEGYTQNQVDRYLDLAGDVEITKTHGRKPVAGLNCMNEYLWVIPEPINEDELYQELHSKEVNRMICKAAGFLETGYPIEFFEEDMRRVGILPKKTF